MGKERKADHPTISLVLGSGGARGLAHIGVIDVLEQQGYRIRSIAGASMGALVGGIYARGQLDAYRQWVTALQRMDVVRLLDPSWGRNALFKGERIISVLKDLIGDCDIEDLPVAFTAVATDVDTEKEVWLNSGSLFDAIRASIAIPTVFTPSRHQGHRLVDGGLVNPIPIAPTLNDRTDLTIAVNLSGKPDGEPAAPPPEPHPADSYQARIAEFIDSLQRRLGNDDEEQDLDLFELISRSFDTMQNTIARFKLAAYSPDVVIDIPKNACAFYEFHRAGELIDIGRRRAEQALSALER
jgi:NTE family protein